MTLRIATFNCENLLSRAKILNFDSDAEAARPLEDLAALDGILAKPVYAETDKERILALVKSLAEFVDVRELRGKLLARRKVDGRWREYVKPGGRGEWVGGLSLVPDPLPTRAQENTARVIREVGADVQGLVEVEDRPTLERFGNQAALKGAYPYNLVVDGNDSRGIDVGLLSRFPLGRVRTHIFDPAPTGQRIFSRDCLEVEVLLPGGRPLFLLLNHFKSQGYGSPADNDARRTAQAGRVIQILGGYDLTRDLVVVAGDFNDRPDHAPVAGLVHLPGLTDVLARKFADPRDRWTYKDRSQIDYLLVSQPLADAMADAGVERRGLFRLERLTRGAEHSFETVTDDANDASDHAAVWADFAV